VPSDSDDQAMSRRPVRSYHQRKGKVTPTQERGLAEGWSLWGIESPAGKLAIDQLFGGSPVVLDIGFGMGESVLMLAQANPKIGVLGLEVHERGVGQLLAGVQEAGLRNVRVWRADAAEVVRDHLPAGSLAGVRLFFPDPWPKSRHHKRRLVQPSWAADVVHTLEPGGYLYCATDWEPYAEHMCEVLDVEPGLIRRDDLVAEFRATRPTTRYEALGIARGHRVTDLVYLRS
jgi:tRNA (guanine-N7-)-methyltransferase